MSNTRSKKKVTLNTVSVKLGCNCKTSKLLSSFFNPKPSSKTPSNLSYHNKTTTTTDSSSTFSPFTSSSTSSNPSSVVAVEKESNDPYLDFRKSMLQMIVENEIYSRDHLQQLLNCFLHLNSPSLHPIIIRAFTDISNAFFYYANPNYNYDYNYSSPINFN